MKMTCKVFSAADIFEGWGGGGGGGKIYLFTPCEVH